VALEPGLGAHDDGARLDGHRQLDRHRRPRPGQERR
jgi:hypothetical protein